MLKTINTVVYKHEMKTSATLGQPLQLSIVMPCLNEAETLACCIAKAQSALAQSHITGEIIVADNGSTDGSQEIARQAGARVVNVPTKGYGSALLGGIAAARGPFVIMGDSDDSHDLAHLSPFIDKLQEGYDLVVGNRFRGGIQPGAMSPLHRYVGNPLLTGVGRLFFGSPCRDFHCGLRGFRKEAIMRLGLCTTGMEFASEMIVKATLHKLKITEVPTKMWPDRRNRPPHLRSWSDGWRHLRFLLFYCPRWLFLVPGLLLILVGLSVGLTVGSGLREMTGPLFGIPTMLYAAVAVILGFQSICFALFTKVFAISEGLLPEDKMLKKAFGLVSLETGLMAGALLVTTGLAFSLWAVWAWQEGVIGAAEMAQTIRLVITGMTALTVGCQTIFASFFLSALGLKRR